jgi:hypothetical protein
MLPQAILGHGNIHELVPLVPPRCPGIRSAIADSQVLNQRAGIYTVWDGDALMWACPDETCSPAPTRPNLHAPTEVDLDYQFSRT